MKTLKDRERSGSGEVNLRKRKEKVEKDASERGLEAMKINSHSLTLKKTLGST